MISWTTTASSSANLFKVQTPVVQTLDSTTHRISIMEINYAIRWIEIYPMDSAIQRLNNQGHELMLSVLVAFFKLSSINNFFTYPILGTRGELSGKPSGLINGNAGTWSFHGLVQMSWSLSTIVFRSSGVGVVGFDVSSLAPLMLWMDLNHFEGSLERVVATLFW